ncbi:MAG: hypothetical protein AAF802_29020 [Planctomycetota bacterium]
MRKGTDLMRSSFVVLYGASIVMLTSGCNLLPSRFRPEQTSVTSALSESQPDDQIKKRVSNPQAREIRFDGQELVLGGGDCQSIPVEQLRELVVSLREQERFRSAGETVRLHRRSATRWVLESLTKADEELIRWVAATLDQDSTSPVHSELCRAAADDSSASKTFDSARRECMTSLANGGVNADAIDKLSTSAAKLGSPLAQLESERLIALTEIASGQAAPAALRFTAMAEAAAQHAASDLSAQFWLLASEAHLRAEAIDLSAASWRAAVRTQVTAMTQHSRGPQALPPLDTQFWEQVDRLRPPGVELPPEVSLAMNPWKLRIGLGSDHDLSAEPSLWSAVAACQLTTGQPHLATLSIKRAEVNACESAKPWLQVALGRSIAAQGQVPVATTILGSLTTNADLNVRAASLAALGSIKLQSGAYEQGSRFLIQALSVDGAGQWPGRLAAEADLANVRLIVGELDDARDALHSVQQKLALNGRWQSLVQSLENEAAILEFDGDKKAAKEIRRRIAEVEQPPTSARMTG